MTREADPILDRDYNGTDRLNFSEGILLGADDFRDEQSYHRSRLSQVLRHLFGTGAVWGMRVDLVAQDEPNGGRDWEVQVQAGMVLDNAGRLVEVPSRACASIKRWREAQLISDLEAAVMDTVDGPRLIADVFVRFVACRRGKRPAFRVGPFDATDSVTDSRVRDGYQLALVPRIEASSIGDQDESRLPNSNWALRVRTFLQQTSQADPGTLDQTIERYHTNLLNLSYDVGPHPLSDHMQPPSRTLPDSPDVDRPNDPPPRYDPTEVARDDTSVLLARLRLPLEQAPEDPRPRIDTSGAPPPANNLIRRFVHAPNVIIGMTTP